MDFKLFKVAVAKQFDRMAKTGALFRTGVTFHDTSNETNVLQPGMWETYLGAFPEGTNPIYKERTEHDCSCCKGFIRAIGNVVCFIEGRCVSVWDVDVADPGYQAVADAMSTLVLSHPVVDVFLHLERTAGTDHSRIMVDERVQSFDHFFVNVPEACHRKGSDIPTALGETRSAHDVLLRSLGTITDGAIETVLDLIAQNTLYRGEENKAAVTLFKELKQQYGRFDPLHRDNFVWMNLAGTPGSVARIRNTAIGTLLVDLSEDRDIDHAVAAFEAKVAPANYKRPTALVTPAMIKKAKEAVELLGLNSALERRYATIEDITVNNILFTNRNARRAMGYDVFASMTASAPVSTKSLDKFEDVPIAKFLADILPRAESIELLVENRHAPNFVSLIAPADPTAAALFKWQNGFSWSYNGDVADSIKERVKAAGGNVTGDLCCRLSWSNFDDLDLHLVEPDGHEIYFADQHSRSGGRLDVDMNAGGGTTRTPVENIFYEHAGMLREGTYHLFVNQFSKRESQDVGFEAEIDFMGTVHSFAHPQAVTNRDTVTVAKFVYSHKDGLHIVESLPSTSTAAKGKEMWGIHTQTFQPVNVIMLSPNHWDERPVGNKHLFFMLEACRNEGVARGFFNEFLKEELNPHRKVIEIVGSKLKTEHSARQLSGLGFSSTQPNKVTCRIKGSFSRVINLVF